LHLQNPFLTNFINYPMGVNMMTNTFLPALGLLTAPITFLGGPALSLNLLSVVAISGSATAAFVVFRRWSDWAPAAYVGALLYACSPYMASQGLDHIDVAFVPYPPLVLLLLDEILIRQRRSARLAGVALGLLFSIQLLISDDVLGSTFVMASIGLVFLVVFRWNYVMERMAHALRALVIAFGIGLVVGAYPIWLYVFGPEHLNGPAHAPVTVGFLQSDLVTMFLPSSVQLISPSGLQSVTAALSPAQLWAGENGVYIGIPLFLVSVALAVKFWRVGIVRFASVMALSALVLSCGATLMVDGHSTGIPLPFRIFSSLPFLDSFIAARFTLYVFLFCGLLLTVGMDQIHRLGIGRLPAGRLGTVAAAAIAVFALLPLVPAWPYPSSTIGVPAYFTSSQARSIPFNSVVLTYPFPRWPFVQTMYWQAYDGFRYKLPGGYVISVDASGTPTTTGTLSSTESFLDDCEDGVSPGPASIYGPAIATDLQNWGVSTVVVTEFAPNPQCAVEVFSAVLGRSPHETSGVWVWTHVGSDLASS
jgi:hypothetical protein